MYPFNSSMVNDDIGVNDGRPKLGKDHVFSFLRVKSFVGDAVVSYSSLMCHRVECLREVNP